MDKNRIDTAWELVMRLHGKFIGNLCLLTKSPGDFKSTGQTPKEHNQLQRRNKFQYFTVLKTAFQNSLCHRYPKDCWSHPQHGSENHVMLMMLVEEPHQWLILSKSSMPHFLELLF